MTDHEQALEEAIQNITPDLWVILKYPQLGFTDWAWERGGDYVEGYAAGPVDKLTSSFIFTKHDVRCAKRHERERIVAIVADREAARAMLWSIHARQEVRDLALKPHREAMAAITADANADIDALLAGVMA